MDDITIRKAVRDNYGAIAKGVEDKCGCGGACCPGTGSARDAGKAIGYSDEQMQSVPTGANLGLGCGNPTALASLAPGETVLDLGAGAGFDCFLAAARVGEKGMVIGVDMTPDMVELARQNARKTGAKNVEFRLGEIERLPVADASVDVIISNCVINLSPDKSSVFNEAFRVLKPGGRLMVSDIVLRGRLPEKLERHIPAVVGCISGAIQVDAYLSMISAAGFTNAAVIEQRSDVTGYWVEEVMTDDLLSDMGITREQAKKYAEAVVSAAITAVK